MAKSNVTTCASFAH